jgi:NAD+ diphosphatase
LRHDEAAVGALLTGGAARIIPVWRERHLIEGEAARVLRYDEAEPLARTMTFLGLAGDEPWFAAGLAGEEPPFLANGCEYRALNDVVLLLPGDQAAMLAYARAMVIWHDNHRFCGRCGTATASTEAGHSRICTNPACGHRTFPRTDPVVITLITNGERCLLGRQAAWATGTYSAIAGFVEPGETLETAVRREALEETGITVGAVRYVASQPWPFPASLMLGFEADALTTAITLADNELEDCRWFTRADVRSFGERGSPKPGFKLPNRYAIARLLLERWLNR